MAYAMSNIQLTAIPLLFLIASSHPKTTTNQIWESVDMILDPFPQAGLKTLFQSDWQPPFVEPRFGPLTINCRNTAPIGNMARKLVAIDQQESFSPRTDIDIGCRV